jgi:hypothetical protein
MKARYLAQIYSYFSRLSRKLAIQVCIGYFSDGKERHRTISIPNVRRGSLLRKILRQVLHDGYLVILLLSDHENRVDDAAHGIAKKQGRVL